MGGEGGSSQHNAHKQFFSKDEAYQFMGNIKGTPAHWKTFLCEA